MVIQKQRESRLVTIVVTNQGTGQKCPIHKIPARMVSRAEIFGLVGQHAQGKRVDLSDFVFEYDFKNEIEVPLSEEDFNLVLAAESRQAVL